MADAADLYRRFAEVEARGLSPIYEQWALGVAAEPRLCALIDRLPEPKRQVNLVFAAARLHGVPLGEWPAARAWFLAHWEELVPTILARATQTNEAGRCATLLPLLSEVPGPLALLEVGASAGLCLYPDRYSYRYRVGDDEFAIDPAAGASAVVLPCEFSGSAPPMRLPDVVWRAGIDLNPLDVGDPTDRAWLEALLWPEHDERRERLLAASAIAAADPPRIVAGNLLDELEPLAAQAPPEATLVIYHCAVLMYLTPGDRERFTAHVGRLAASRPVVWIANEAPGVLPTVTERLPADIDTRGTFVESVDGTARAVVHPHGRWYRGL